MILKKIAHKVAQAFRLAQAADKKLSTGIAAALDAKAEQLREYEKSFEPEPPKPDPLLEARAHITGAGWIQCSSSHICAPENRGSIEAGAIESPDQ